VDSGRQLFALARLTMIAGSDGTSFYQYRGAGCQKKALAASLREDFSLDIPFHRTRFNYLLDGQQRLSTICGALYRDSLINIAKIVVW
jgi:hypothetical protein